MYDLSTKYYSIVESFAVKIDEGSASLVHLCSQDSHVEFELAFTHPLVYTVDL